jgi:hypothetical protein
MLSTIYLLLWADYLSFIILLSVLILLSLIMIAPYDSKFFTIFEETV